MTRRVHLLVARSKEDTFDREIRTLQTVAQLHREKGLDGVLADELCNWRTVEGYCQTNALDYSLITCEEDKMKQFDVYTRKWKGVNKVSLAYITDAHEPSKVDVLAKKLKDRLFTSDIRSI